MQIINRKISELLFSEYNPRKLTKQQMEQLKQSLEGFGIVEPVVINSNPDRKDIIIGGHQRIKVAKELGYMEFPCIEINLTIEREKELNIRLNKNVGEWNWEALINSFSTSELLNWGFTDKEIPPMPVGEPEMGEDDVPEPPKEIKTKNGDLYQLGVHRLLCGDATISENVEKLAGDEKVYLIFTSPPYNMKAGLYAGYKDNRNNSDFVLFNIQVLMNWKKTLTKHSFVFWNMSYNKNSGGSFLEVFYQFMKNSGFIFLEDIVWDKGHGMPLNEQLTRQYEHLLVMNESMENIHFIDHFGVFGIKRVPFNTKTKRGITNYWRVDTFKSQSEKMKAAFPVELPCKAITISTTHGDTIADPFGGSGTTLIAAEKTGRKCLTIELDPVNCDIIVSRYVKFTGNKKIKLNDQEIEWNEN